MQTFEYLQKLHILLLYFIISGNINLLFKMLTSIYLVRKASKK